MGIRKNRGIDFTNILSKIKKDKFLNWFRQERINIFVVFAIIAVSFLLYYKSIYFGYTYLDDTQLLLNRGEFLSNLGNIFKSFEKNVFYLAIQNSSYYRPILTVSFILDTVFFGNNVMVYHLVNIFLHIISSVILFYLLKKILKSQKISFFLTILFVAHPSLMQGIVWIPGRNDILLVIFSLLSFDYFLNFMKSRGNKNMLFFAFFFLLALFTKETAFFLPLIFIYYLLFVSKKYLNKKMWVGFITLLFSCIFLAVFSRSLVLKSGSFDIKQIIVSVGRNSLPGTLYYLGKVFNPVNLGVTSVLKDKIYWFGIVSIVFLALLVLTTEKSKRRYSYFGIFWFVVLLLPVFVSTRNFGDLLVFEHRLYLPLFGILLVLGVNKFFRRIINSKFSYFILAAYLLFSFWVVKSNIGYFKDGISFWKKAYKDNPEESLNAANLGLIYLKSSKYNEAIKMYRLALAKNPLGRGSRYNVGLAYMSLSEYQKAEEEFKEEIRLFPKLPLGYFGLAKLYQKEGDLTKAEEYYLAVIKIAPDSVKAYMNLAIIYAGQGRIDEGVKMYNEVKKRGVEY